MIRYKIYQNQQQKGLNAGKWFARAPAGTECVQRLHPGGGHRGHGGLFGGGA